MLALRANTANNRRQMNDHIGTEIGIHVAHVFALAQVVIFHERHKNVVCAARLERRRDKAPQKARAASYHNSFVFQLHTAPLFHIPFGLAGNKGSLPLAIYSEFSWRRAM